MTTPKSDQQAAEQGAAPDRLQLRSFLTSLPAAGELGRCAVARSFNVALDLLYESSKLLGGEQNEKVFRGGYDLRGDIGEPANKNAGANLWRLVWWLWQQCVLRSRINTPAVQTQSALPQARLPEKVRTP